MHEQNGYRDSVASHERREQHSPLSMMWSKLEDVIADMELTIRKIGIIVMHLQFRYLCCQALNGVFQVIHINLQKFSTTRMQTATRSILSSYLLMLAREGSYAKNLNLLNLPINKSQ